MFEISILILRHHGPGFFLISDKVTCRLGLRLVFAVSDDSGKYSGFEDGSKGIRGSGLLGFFLEFYLRRKPRMGLLGKLPGFPSQMPSLPWKPVRSREGVKKKRKRKKKMCLCHAASGPNRTLSRSGRGLPRPWQEPHSGDSCAILLGGRSRGSPSRTEGSGGEHRVTRPSQEKDQKHTYQTPGIHTQEASCFHRLGKGRLVSHGCHLSLHNSAPGAKLRVHLLGVWSQMASNHSRRRGGLTSSHALGTEAWKGTEPHA